MRRAAVGMVLAELLTALGLGSGHAIRVPPATMAVMAVLAVLFAADLLAGE